MTSRSKPSGFAEAQQATFAVGDASTVAREDALTHGGRLKVGPGGRVLIPADMRAALGVAEGDMLLATLEDGELRLMSGATAVKRAQALMRANLQGHGSLTEELLAERRADAARGR
jgi:antitoxin PrlF